jgi:coatomer protein complex subunit gamma
MLVSIERFLKQGAVDKDPAVSSAALIAGIHLMKVNADTVRKHLCITK